MIVVKPDVISAVFCGISIQKEACTIFRYLATIVAVGCEALAISATLLQEVSPGSKEDSKAEGVNMSMVSIVLPTATYIQMYENVQCVVS